VLSAVNDIAACRAFPSSPSAHDAIPCDVRFVSTRGTVRKSGYWLAQRQMFGFGVKLSRSRLKGWVRPSDSSGCAVDLSAQSFRTLGVGRQHVAFKRRGRART